MSRSKVPRYHWHHLRYHDHASLTLSPSHLTLSPHPLTSPSHLTLLHPEFAQHVNSSCGLSVRLGVPRMQTGSTLSRTLGHAAYPLTRTVLLLIIKSRMSILRTAMSRVVISLMGILFVVLAWFVILRHCTAKKEAEEEERSIISLRTTLESKGDTLCVLSDRPLYEQALRIGCYEVVSLGDVLGCAVGSKATKRFRSSASNLLKTLLIAQNARRSLTFLRNMLLLVFYGKSRIGLHASVPHAGLPLLLLRRLLLLPTSAQCLSGLVWVATAYPEYMILEHSFSVLLACLKKIVKLISYYLAWGACLCTSNCRCCFKTEAWEKQKEKAKQVAAKIEKVFVTIVEGESRLSSLMPSTSPSSTCSSSTSASSASSSTFASSASPSSPPTSPRSDPIAQQVRASPQSSSSSRAKAAHTT